MTLPSPFVYDPAQHCHLLVQVAQIHAECILADGTLATFLPDAETHTMDLEKLIKYWSTISSEVEIGTRVVVLQLSSPAPSGQHTLEEVTGVATLYMPETETGPFRSEVHKLFVARKYRKQGVARELMKKVEDVALKRGRGLVMLDTTLGSGAEFLYPKLGYIEWGRIPRYGIHPLTRELQDEVFFYKDLRKH